MTPDSRLQTPDLDERMMRRALELAARGVGQVSPGPLVGCVIATDDGEIVGEGFYLYEGIKHAETLALEEAGTAALGATVYVTLEPHAHQGRTPPCTDALISAGIKRVVAPIEDPNPKVSGQGFTHLRAVNVEVSTGVMAREASRLNEKYIHFMRTGLPFVHLKLASSLDGRIATRTGDSRWITGEESRARVQQLRHEYDAILVGAGTVAADDPLLTDRSGLKRRLPLTRIVLNDALRISPASNLAKTAGEAPVLVFTSESADESLGSKLENCGVQVWRQPGGARDAGAVLREVARRDLQSVIIEGGSTVAGAFLDAGLVNKVSFFIAPIIIGGRDAPAAIGGTGAEKIADTFRLQDVEITARGPDIEVTGYTTKG